MNKTKVRFEIQYEAELPEDVSIEMFQHALMKNTFDIYKVPIGDFYDGNIVFAKREENINVYTTNDLEDRIGQSFMEWADCYFGDDTKLNQRTTRRAMYSDYYDFQAENGLKRFTVSSIGFKNKLLMYCELKNYSFNPNIASGERDTSGGVEYFTICTTPQNCVQ